MIGAVENAILERLRIAGDPAAGVLGYSFESLQTYPEDWQAFWDQSSSKLLRYPAAFVTFGGFGSTTSYVGGVRGPAAFGLIVVSKSLRNQRDSREGSGLAGDIGSYQLAVDAIGLLEGCRLGLPIGPLQTKSLQFVTLTQKQRDLGLSMLALRFEADLNFGEQYLEPDREFLGDLSTFAVTWDLPPKDSAAEMTQTVTIDQEEA